MKRIIWAVVGIGVCLLAFRFGPFIPAYAQDADWQKVDETWAASPPSRTTSAVSAFPAPISP